MKTKSYLTYLLGIFVTLTACSSNDDTGNVSADYMKVTDVVIEGQASSGTLHIDADCSWTVTTDANWVTVGTPQGEGSADVTLTTGTNPSSVEARSCQLKVASKGGVTRLVTLTQSTNNEQLEVSTTTIDYPTEGGQIQFTITSNTSWIITGGADWLTLSESAGQNNGSITLTAQVNELEDTRKATITVTGNGGKACNIEVSQAAKTVYLLIIPEEISATAKGDTYAINVVSNTNWTVLPSIDSWVTLEQDNGSNDGTFRVTLADNPNSSTRIVNIRVTSASGRNEMTCVITQAAATPPTLTLPQSSSVTRYEVTVSSNFNSPLDITECGFCYSDTNVAPTISNSSVTASAQGTSGSISVKLENLKSGKTYHIRAWARNANGIGYSETLDVKTEGNTPGEDENPTPTL
ncbi:MAG: BACON domain-containing protein [Bacteroidaceae bacterium]|nr:BACON domain-containing protein [Bacteroidaceae bacterium]